MVKRLGVLSTVLNLGISNVFYIIWYKVSKSIGIQKFFFPIRQFTTDCTYFDPKNCSQLITTSNDAAIIDEADNLLRGNILCFSKSLKFVGTPPNWERNPYNGQTFPNSHMHWTELPDFDTTFGDIKNIWELSRFSWLIIFARAYAVTGSRIYIARMNQWLSDWSMRNPLNQGPNWKCGQEASFRVINLMNSSLILDNIQYPAACMTESIYLHLQRISANIRYAIAQDNNHGTSEAAALFMGGSWLFSINPKLFPLAKHYADKGRFWLENRVSRLIEIDGAFSQHSMTYHRLMLDTMIFVEKWRQKLSLKLFSDKFYSRISAAIAWLEMFTDPQSGDAPNFGANDGAFLLNLHSCDYRDFRPTVQTARVIFTQKKAYPAGKWDEPLSWLNIQASQVVQESFPLRSKMLDSGYVYLNGGDSWALIRFPYFKFRPSHNDILHFDLWYKGQNIIFDSGTYSYNQSDKKQIFNLKSVHFHNTVSFERKEQMPEISRFLLGDWLKPDYSLAVQKIDDALSWEGQYTSKNGFKHRRRVFFKKDSWYIEDYMDGGFSSAVIGFNIDFGEYTIQENQIKTAWGNIVIPVNSTFKIVPSIASRYYQEKFNVARLEIVAREPGSYTTTFELM